MTRDEQGIRMYKVALAIGGALNIVDQICRDGDKDLVEGERAAIEAIYEHGVPLAAALRAIGMRLNRAALYGALDIGAE